jgi:sigma-B regulation protein RsbU (phosphoserine phosphatase)
MKPWTALPKPLLATVAAILAIVTTFYSVLWMYDVRHASAVVELGFNKAHTTQGVFDEKTHSIPVLDVAPGSPAERAGLRANDRIISVNGEGLMTSAPLDEAWNRGRPGDGVELTVARPGEAAPIHLHAIFRAAMGDGGSEGLARASALQVTGSFPVLFLVVGFVVLFLRLDDPNAWLLALLFCGFVTAPGFPNASGLPAELRRFGLAYRSVFSSLVPALFYLFFAVFPSRSPLDRLISALKWIGLAVGAFLIVPGLATGNPRLPMAIVKAVGEHASRLAIFSWRYSFFALGLISLAGNAFEKASPPEARLKARVILWGTLLGVLPVVVERAAIDFGGYRPPFWLDTVLVLFVLLYPLSFAYAVVKYRVMEIPVLLRAGARYVLVQRGFIVLLFAAGAIAIGFYVNIVSRYIRTDPNMGLAASVVFGIALVWVASPLVKRGTERIDRAFFRSAYDARVILQDLAEKTRRVSDRDELARLLEHHVREALHPKDLACYLEEGEGCLVGKCGAVPHGLEALSASEPVLLELAVRGKSEDVPPAGSRDAAKFAIFDSMEPECLVPISERTSRLIGLLVLGPRLSEEPYTGEDKRLLDSVASQAGIALENIRLAEKMAARLEADLRATHELEIAREVQARLLPQKMPPLETLEYAGGCIQARQVGGDYYDFLDLGPGRVGLVLADISGKGISGAMLMANLQANLRSQYAVALEDLPGLLRSVNRLFHQNTPDDCYATLFFADYNDAERRLRYANCGHNFPLLLRASGELERLAATATVLGMFSDWTCSVEEILLQPGDLLVMYTDGISEAPDSSGEEFGEARLIETIRRNCHLSPTALIGKIQATVQEFSHSGQADDLTMVIGRSVSARPERGAS